MTKPRDPETLLKHALFLSNFPEYTLKIKKSFKGKQQYEQNVSLNHTDMHKPPFRAHITAGGYFINLDDIDTPRSKVPTIMCDLMLKKLYPGNHHNLTEECSSYQYGQNSGQASNDNSFESKHKIYKKQNTDNFSSRKKRLEPGLSTGRDEMAGRPVPSRFFAGRDGTSLLFSKVCPVNSDR